MNQLMKNVLKTALNAESTEHLGHDHSETPLGSNIPNKTRAKMVLTKKTAKMARRCGHRCFLS